MTNYHPLYICTDLVLEGLILGNIDGRISEENSFTAF